MNVPKHFREMVEQAGGIPYAMFETGLPGIEPLVMFNSRETGTTLAVPVSKMSAAAVREHIKTSNKLFKGESR